MRQINFILLCFGFLLVLGGCSKFSKLQKSTDVMEKYNGALAYYDKKDYYRAGELLNEVIPLLRGTEQAEKALFFRAYCTYQLRELILSAYHFKSFVETYPRSAMAEEAMYLYCMSLYEDSPPYYLDQSNTVETLDAINSFLLNFPDNPNKERIASIAELCKVKLEVKAWENTKLYYKTENYKAASIALETFSKDYPESKFLEECYYLQVATQYFFAKNSIDTKKNERYDVLVDKYQNFIDKYPSSRFAKEAERYYKVAQARLGNSSASEEITKE
jgi:outer membrane protein assembly factor BamD